MRGSGWGLPFIKSGAVGAGFFAVNAAGRARWGRFPDIISDDTYVRLQFTPDERIEVEATYTWPMVEGLAALVRVRRRRTQVCVKSPRAIRRSCRTKASLGWVWVGLLRWPLTMPLCLCRVCERACSDADGSKQRPMDTRTLGAKRMTTP